MHDTLDIKKDFSLDNLGLPPVSQIGMVVKNLDEGVRFYRNFLNIKKWYLTKIIECDYDYRGKKIDNLLEIAVGYTGKTQVELIRVRGNDDNCYSELLGHGGSGFHHFGVVVNNLQREKEKMIDAGFNPLQEGTLRYGGGGATQVAYMDTMESAGFILELIETKAFGINLGMPRWLVSLGRITGDTALIKPVD